METVDKFSCISFLFMYNCCTVFVAYLCITTINDNNNYYLYYNWSIMHNCTLKWDPTPHFALHFFLLLGLDPSDQPTPLENIPDVLEPLWTEKRTQQHEQQQLRYLFTAILYDVMLPTTTATTWTTNHTHVTNFKPNQNQLRNTRQLCYICT